MAERQPDRDPLVHTIMRKFVTSHLRDADLLAYDAHNEHDTAAQTRAKLHLARCLICQQRLAFLQEVVAETESMSPSAVPQDYYEIARRLLSSTAPTPAQSAPAVPGLRPSGTSRQTVWQRFLDTWERQVAVITLPLGGRMPGLAAQYATAPASKARMAANGLAVLPQADDHGGWFITLSSEREEHAGGLFALVYMVDDGEERLFFQGFSVLSTTSDDAYSFTSVVHVPHEDMLSWPSNGQFKVDPESVDQETLQQEDVAALQWSFCHAADDISREAWRTFCQRHRENSALPQAVRAWCASPVAWPS